MLAANEVHLWTTSLDADGGALAASWSMLSPLERGRAEAFRFPKHQRRFVVTRAVLRQLLGRYLNEPPEKVVLNASSSGKPYVENQLQFNLSRSHERAAYVFTLGRRVGIDLERIRPLPDTLRIAEQNFAQPELNALLQVQQAQRQEMFFRLWTRKEAYTKARGEGLSIDLKSFVVPLEHGAASWRLVAEHSDNTAAWYCADFVAGSDYVGSIVADGEACALHQYFI